MDDQKLRASILEAVTKEVDAWFIEQKAISDPIEYEKHLLERTLNIGKTMLSKGRGEVSRDRNKKKGLLHFLEKLI